MADQESLREPLVGQEAVDLSIPTAKTDSIVQLPFSNGHSDETGVHLWTVDWLSGEIKKQLRVAGPMIFVSLLQGSLFVVSSMFVGHLGELELASSSIATSFASVTGSSILLGMSSALETLCGQAYGAKQYRMLGIFLQRALLVTYITTIPVAILWYNMGYVLKALWQDPEIADMAGVYARWLLPSLFAIASFHPLVRFLQTQSVVLPMTLMSMATLALHIPLCWLLIFKLGVGFRGAAIASGLSNWLYVLLLVAYVKFSPNCKKTWTSFSMEAFNDLGAFFKLAIPSAVMICLEYWSFEMLVLLSGLMPNPQLETSTLSICLTSLSVAYMIPLGLSAGVSTRVSNELGAGHPRHAKSAVTVGIIMALMVGLSMGVLLLSLRNVIGLAFTNEAEVINYVSHCVPLLAAVTGMDALQSVLSGVARGCGWQAFGAFANLAAYYIVGLPSAITLAFVFHFNSKGLWMGMMGGIATQAVILLIITLCTNWEKQAKNAVARVYSSASTTLPIQSNCNSNEEISYLPKNESDYLAIQ